MKLGHPVVVKSVANLDICFFTTCDRVTYVENEVQYLFANLVTIFFN